VLTLKKERASSEPEVHDFPFGRTALSIQKSHETSRWPGWVLAFALILTGLLWIVRDSGGDLPRFLSMILGLAISILSVDAVFVKSRRPLGLLGLAVLIVVWISTERDTVFHDFANAGWVGAAMALAIRLRPWPGRRGSTSSQADGSISGRTDELKGSQSRMIALGAVLLLVILALSIGTQFTRRYELLTMWPSITLFDKSRGCVVRLAGLGLVDVLCIK
jgi:hypothetical protein